MIGYALAVICVLAEHEPMLKSTAPESPNGVPVVNTCAIRRVDGSGTCREFAHSATDRRRARESWSGVTPLAAWCWSRWP